MHSDLSCGLDGGAGCRRSSDIRHLEPRLRRAHRDDELAGKPLHHDFLAHRPRVAGGRERTAAGRFRFQGHRTVLTR